jgi:hypothetical protein
MTEPEQHTLLLLYLSNESLNVVLGSDLLQHPDHSLIGTSVLRTVEGTSSHSNGSININTRASHMSHKGCRTIHFVLSMQNEQDLKSPRQLRMRFEGALIQPIHHE